MTPRNLQIINRKGNLDDLNDAGGIYQYAKQIHSKYGKIAGFWLGENYIVSVACPYLWKDILPLFDRPRKYSYYTMRYDTIRYDAIRHDTMQYDTMRCNTTVYYTIRCNTTRHDTMQY